MFIMVVAIVVAVFGCQCCFKPRFLGLFSMFCFVCFLHISLGAQHISRFERLAARAQTMD